MSSAHQALIDERFACLEDDDGVRMSRENNLQELKDQLDTFEQTIVQLSMVNPRTLSELRGLADQLRRETQRLEARLPIYARRRELVEAVENNRVVIIKADTGSGKSSQLVQYLYDAGFTTKGAASSPADGSVQSGER